MVKCHFLVAMFLSVSFLFLIIAYQLRPSPASKAMPMKKPAGLGKAKPAAVVPVSKSRSCKDAKGSATSRSDSAAQTRAMNLLMKALGK